MRNKLQELRKNKKGFTLIELIVVIAVIGILVLLAAPKFLGYTKDAHVATMQADAKVLSNAALVYNIDQETEGGEETWPVTSAEATSISVGGETYSVKALDETKLKGSYYKSLKGDIADYGLVVEGELEGDVLHKTGVEDKDGIKHYGVDVKETE